MLFFPTKLVLRTPHPATSHPLSSVADFFPPTNLHPEIKKFHPELFQVRPYPSEYGEDDLQDPEERAEDPHVDEGEQGEEDSPQDSQGHGYLWDKINNILWDKINIYVAMVKKYNYLYSHW